MKTSPHQEWRLHNGEVDVPEWFVRYTERVVRETVEACEKSICVNEPPFDWKQDAKIAYGLGIADALDSLTTQTITGAFKLNSMTKKLKGDVTFTQKVTHKYDIALYGGLLFCILYNTYFGWNDEPVNSWERLFDLVASCTMLYGLIGVIAQSVFEDGMRNGRTILTIQNVDNDE